MSSTQELQIILKAIDNASGALGSVKSQLTALENTAKSAQPSVANAGAKLTEAGNAASSASPKLQQSANSFRDVGKGADEGGSKLAGILGTFGKVGLGVTALGGAVAGAVGVMGFKFDSFREQAEIAFSVTLGSGEKAKQFLDDLGKFAATTPFDFPGLVTAAKRLTSVGYEGSQVIPIMQALGDATAAMGTGVDGIERATRALQQMQTKGRVTGGEMLQLVEAGIPAWDALANKLGVDVVTAQEMVTSKQVKVNEVVGAIESYAGPAMQRVKGMMEAQSHSFEGLMSTIKDTMQQLAGTVVKPFFELAVDGMQEFVNWFTSPKIEQGAQMIADGLGAAIDKVRDFLTPAFELLGDVLPSVWDAISGFGSNIVDLFESLWSAIEPAVSAIVEWLGDVLPPAFEFAAEVGDKVFSFLSDAITVFAELVIEGIGYVVDGVMMLWDAWSGTLGPLVDYIVESAMAIYEALSYINPFAEHSPSIVSQVEDGVTVIGEAYSRLSSETSSSLESVGGSIQQLTAIMGDNTAESKNAREAQEDILKAFGSAAVDVYSSASSELEGLRQTYEDLGEQIEETESTIKGLEEQFDKAKDRWEDLKDSMFAEELPFDQQGKALSTQMDQIKLQIAKLKQQGPLEIEVTTTTIDDKGKAKTKTDTVDSAIGSQIKALEGQLEQLGLKADELELTEKLQLGPLREQLDAIIEGKDKGNAPWPTFEELKKALLDSRTEMETTGGELDKQKELLKEQKEAYKALGDTIKGQEKSLKEFAAAAKDIATSMEKAASGGGGAAKSLGAATGGLKTDMDGLTDKMAEQQAKMDALAAKSAELAGKTKDLGKASEDQGEKTSKSAAAMKNFKENTEPLTDKLKEFGAQLWESLKPLRPLVDGLKESIVGFKDLEEPIKKLWASFVLFAEALKEVLTSKAAALIFAGVIAALLIALRIVAEVIHNVLIVAIFALTVAFNAAAGLIKAALSVISGVLNVFIGVFTGDWEQAWEGVKQIVEGFWEAIKTVFTLVFDVLNRLTGGALGEIKDKFTGVFGAIKDFLNGAKSFFTDTVPEWFARMKEKLSDLWDAVKTKVENIWNGIKDFFGGIKDFFTDTIPGWFTSLKDKIAKLWQDLKEVTEKLWGDVKAFFEGIKDFFTDTIPGWFGDLWDEVKGLWNTLQTETEDIWNGVKDFFTNTIWGFISDTIPGWFGDLKDKIGGVWDSLRDITTNAWNGLKDGILSAVNGIIGVINGMINSFNGLHIKIPAIEPPGWTHLPGWGGADIRLSIPNIPYLARGVRNFAGGLAIVGENGPELMSLNRGTNVYSNRETREMLGAAAGVNVIFQGPVTIEARDEEEAEQSAQMLGWALLADVRSRGLTG